jgi:hypothetical protein
VPVEVFGYKFCPLLLVNVSDAPHSAIFSVSKITHIASESKRPLGRAGRVTLRWILKIEDVRIRKDSTDFGSTAVMFHTNKVIKHQNSRQLCSVHAIPCIMKTTSEVITAKCSSLFHCSIIIFSIILKHTDASVPSWHRFKNSVAAGTGLLHSQKFITANSVSSLLWNVSRRQNRISVLGSYFEK